MAIILTDDGTLDTVLRCEECGEEMRYNYDGCPENHPQEDECAHYQSFVEWAIEDATEEHACPAAPDAEPTEPQEDDITTTDHETFYQDGKKVLELDRRLSMQSDSDDQPACWYAYGQGFNDGYGYRLEVPAEDYRAALRAYMDRVQFWPDVWFISDHGNAHRIDLTERKE